MEKLDKLDKNGKVGLSGVRPNKKLNPVLQIRFMSLYISIAFWSQQGVSYQRILWY